MKTMTISTANLLAPSFKSTKELYNYCKYEKLSIIWFKYILKINKK
jgi:hypothetical protein